MSPLPRNLTRSLLVMQAIAAATLLRSVLFERWTTVVTSIVLLVGVRAALRSRTWGVGLVLATSTAFAGAVVLGIAPAWFLAVGLAGAIPFALTLKPMMRFDVPATALFAALAGVTGVATAFAWREAAFAIFYALH